MRARRFVAVGALVLAVGVAGCTPDESSSPDPTRPDEASEAPEVEWTVESLATAILEDDVLTVEDPAAVADGVVASERDDWAVRVEVVEVAAYDDGTDVTVVVRSPDGQPAEVDFRGWSDRGTQSDIRGVALVDDANDLRLLPYTAYTSINRQQDVFCVCSTTPLTVGEGDVLSALYPPLADGVDTITLEFPGLEPLTDVPVTWR